MGKHHPLINSSRGKQAETVEPAGTQRHAEFCASPSHKTPALPGQHQSQVFQKQRYNFVILEGHTVFPTTFPLKTSFAQSLTTDLADRSCKQHQMSPGVAAGPSLSLLDGESTSEIHPAFLLDEGKYTTLNQHPYTFEATVFLKFCLQLILADVTNISFPTWFHMISRALCNQSPQDEAAPSAGKQQKATRLCHSGGQQLPAAGNTG